MNNSNEPTDEEVEARLETIGKAAVSRLRDTYGMSRGINPPLLFPGGHPGPVAIRLFELASNHNRRDD